MILAPRGDSFRAPAVILLRRGSPHNQRLPFGLVSLKHKPYTLELHPSPSPDFLVGGFLHALPLFCRLSDLHLHSPKLADAGIASAWALQRRSPAWLSRTRHA